MFIIYDFIYILTAIIYLPVFLLRRKFHPGFNRRFGILPKDLKLRHPIWIHAVSVGEAKAIKGLLEELKKNYPERDFVISTVTPTGNKIAQGLAERNDFVTYLPLDLSFVVAQVLGKIKPSLFILAETEIWPNLISCLHKRQIPIVIVNGRISDASFKGYLSIAFLLKAILNKIYLFCVQTPRDAERLMRLGVLKDKIKITGNMKFDTTDYINFKEEDAALKLKLGLKSREKLLVIGSSHPLEEEIILEAYKKLLQDFPDLRLLIAPRHPERSKDIERIAKTFGFQGVFISGLNPTPDTRDLTPNTYNLTPIFILDTIGELMRFYAIADIVFVAGSLTKNGGHNILEPAALGKPVLFGPHMFNFRDIADLFLENQSALLVQDQEELCARVRDLLNKPEKIELLSKRAREVVLTHQGATQKTVQIIKELCKNISTV